jgi:hypothetical protein
MTNGDIVSDRTSGLKELAATAAQLVEALEGCVTSEMNASSYEKSRPTIWHGRKYVRGGLLRILALTRSCLREIQAGNFAGAALLSRSVMETSAMLVLFSRNLAKATRKIDADRLRAVVFSHYLGSKAFEIPGSAKAPHVMDALRAANEQDEWIQPVYDMLSDVAHPNWAGTTQVFLDDVTPWKTETRINREFARDLATNVLLGLYSIRSALKAATDIDRLLNELSVSQATRGV